MENGFTIIGLIAAALGAALSQRLGAAAPVARARRA